MMEAVVQVSSLQQVFGPSCETQAKNLKHLQQAFSKLYDGMEAQAVIFVNGVAEVMALGADERVSLALGKGLTVLVSKTYPQESIFVNGSQFQEELIFASNGKHQEGIHEKSDELRDLLALIRQGCKRDAVFDGAVIYVHSDISEHLFYYQQCLMLSLALALLIAHQQLSFYTTSSIVALLRQCDSSLSARVLKELLEDYSVGCGRAVLNSRLQIEPQRQLEIRVVDPSSEEPFASDSFPLLSTRKDLMHLDSIASTSHDSLDSLSENSLQGEQLKTTIFGKAQGIQLVICRIQISKEQFQEYQEKMATVRSFTSKISEQSLAGVFKQGWGQARQQGLTNAELDLYSYAQDCQLLLQSFSLSQIDFASFLRLKHDLDVKYQLHNEEVIEIITQLRFLLPRARDFCLVGGSVLLVAVQQSYVQDFKKQICKLLAEYRLSSYLFLDTHERISRTRRQQEAQEAVFHASLSLGCAIFHPKE